MRLLSSYPRCCRMFVSPGTPTKYGLVRSRQGLPTATQLSSTDDASRERPTSDVRLCVVGSEARTWNRDHWAQTWDGMPPSLVGQVGCRPEAPAIKQRRSEPPATEDASESLRLRVRIYGAARAVSRWADGLALASRCGSQCMIKLSPRGSVSSRRFVWVCSVSL
jgi:hypothetical protein